MAAPQRGEAGVSLLETLVALFLVSVLFIAIIGGMLVTASATNTNTDVAAVDSALLVATEELKATALAQPSGYVPCATPTDYALTNAVADAVVTITEVTYWDGTAFVAACPDPALDTGLQQVRLESDSTLVDLTASGVVVLRNPDVGTPVVAP